MSHRSSYTHFAVLIGIDDYPDHPLNSAARDAREAQSFLSSKLKDRVKIYPLIADRNEQHPSASDEYPELRPTRENLIGALNTIANIGHPGCFVYIHFSGHGVMKTSKNKEKEEEEEKEEKEEEEEEEMSEVGLVLLDEHDASGVSCFWSQELVDLVKVMVKKNLIITVVLDCAFSGAVHLPSWLAIPEGWAIIAACGMSPKASGAVFDGVSRGILSYYLYEAIAYLGLTASLKNIYDRLWAKMLGLALNSTPTQSQKQTPILYGNTDQAFFGSLEHDDTGIYFPIIRKLGGIIELHAGHAHGISVGDEFVVVPARRAFEQGSVSLTTKAVRCTGLTSILETSGPSTHSVRTGWLARAVSQSRLQNVSIRLLQSISEKPIWFSNLTARSMRAHDEFKSSSNAFQLALDNDHQYHILDQNGSELANIPAMWQHQLSIDEVCDVLEHLVRFQVALELTNPPSAADYLGNVEILIKYDSKSYAPTDSITIEDGATAEVVLTNRRNTPVFVFSYVLGQHWQVEQLSLGARLVRPKSTSILKQKFVRSMPRSDRHPRPSVYTDVLKIIVTSQPTSFDCLELPKLREFARKKHAVTDRGAIEGSEEWAATNFSICVSRIEDNSSILQSVISNEPPKVFSVMSEDLTNFTSQLSTKPQISGADPLTDDTGSIYSTVMSASDPANKNLIESIADELWLRIASSSQWQNSMTDLRFRIPDLLKAFACQLGHDNSNKEYLDAMVFVRMFRQSIVDAVGARMDAILSQTTQLQHDDEIRPKIPVSEWSLDDKMTYWRTKDNSAQYDQQQEQRDDEEEEEEEEKEEASDAEIDNQYTIHTRTVRDSAEFQWLLERIDREIKYKRSALDSIGSIARQIMQLQSDDRNVSRRPPESISIVFTFRWVPSLLNGSIQKLRDRNFADEEIVSSTTIEQALVLTGGPVDAMAVTCEEYVQGIWGKRGLQLLHSIKQALIYPGKLIEDHVAGNTTIRIQWQNDLFHVSSEGEIHALAELGEILGWLAVALQPSDGVKTTAPIIVAPTMSLREEFKAESESFSPATRRIVCHFSGQQQAAELGSNGQCWFNMFEDPIITGGYPILRRVEEGHGLELSLPIIAVLLRTGRTTIRNGRLTITESSQALIPKLQTEDLIVWHYVYSLDGAPPAYWEVHPHNINIKTSDLFQSRHIIGWCLKATTIAGARGDHYNVQRSRLPAPSSKILLESINISGSQFVGATAPVKIGIRKPATHVPADTFAAQIKLVSKYYILLWDDEEKRGWHLDGLSALLHLLRTSLYRSTTDNMRNAFCLDIDSCADPEGELPEAALGFFFQDGRIHPNMLRQLYPGATEDDTHLMHHQVRSLCNILKEVVLQQDRLSTRDGYQFSTSPRQDLEGWDFVDLATGSNPLKPCGTKLEWRGASWIDLIRSTGTIVLFGRNFGEIIRPSEAIGLCEQWSTLPKGQYHIATYTSTMKSIIDVHGDIETIPIKLTNSLVLRHPTSFFLTCGCKGKSGEHTDFVQTILPAKSQPLLPNASIANWPKNSAIIFGQNNHAHRWSHDRGDPRTTGQPSKRTRHSQSAAEQNASEASPSSSREITNSTGALTLDTNATSQTSNVIRNSHLSRLKAASLRFKGKFTLPTARK